MEKPFLLLPQSLQSALTILARTCGICDQEVKSVEVMVAVEWTWARKGRGRVQGAEVFYSTQKCLDSGQKSIDSGSPVLGITLLLCDPQQVAHPLYLCLCFLICKIGLIMPSS